MQNIGRSITQNQDKVSVQQLDTAKLSTPHSSNCSTADIESDPYCGQKADFAELDSSDSDEESVSEDLEDAEVGDGAFLLESDENGRTVDPETQARLEALLEAAGIGKLSSGDGKHLADPDVLRRLTSSVSCALDEAAAALTRMRSDNPRHSEKSNLARTLVEACSDGDVGTVRRLLTEGRSVHETTEDGESLLSLACSAGYYELAQVLIAMNANVEDRGIKGDCTPIMEAASAGHAQMVTLLIENGADVNAQSSSGNTPLMYGCAGGHDEVVKILLANGANVEDHNENGHTPLMEAASAGHVGVAKILLENGAGINTHSNEFKESALTLACYKGHLDMVRFLLLAGADQEHKTDEMHTALMEASMDGHVEVARLLLDSGAQVNMPTDSFESPLTLAACGGHVDLAMLLIERGANIEEVNDEGYTPLMEAAREGHEEMVGLLLSQGANINAQTEETQETALTLACCGGFLEVADYLIKAGANIELGASTPLMEAAQEGHLDLVRYLLEVNADVHTQTQTGDTALTYACENGHTDVAELLLQYGADLEHESEGGRTPLMKACRAGHICTVKFLISKHADVNRQTTNNDHTPLSLACAGGHQQVVETLLKLCADPFHKLKDNSTMLIEAAKGGHTTVVQLLLDYPHSIMMNHPHQNQIPNMSGLHEVPDAVRIQEDLSSRMLQMSPNQNSISQRPHLDSIAQVNLSQPNSQKNSIINAQPALVNTLPLDMSRLSDQGNNPPMTLLGTAASSSSCLPQVNAPQASLLAHIKRSQQAGMNQSNFTQGLVSQGLNEGLMLPSASFSNGATNVVTSNSLPTSLPQLSSSVIDSAKTTTLTTSTVPALASFCQTPVQSNLSVSGISNLVSMNPGLQQPLQSKQKSLLRKNRISSGNIFESTNNDAQINSEQSRIKALGDSVDKDESSILDKGSTFDPEAENRKQQSSKEEQIYQKQQILDELHRVERELQVKASIQFLSDNTGPPPSLLPSMPYIDITNNSNQNTGIVCGTGLTFQPPSQTVMHSSTFFSVGKPLSTTDSFGTTPLMHNVKYTQPPRPLHSSTVAEISQNTAISDRPKAKPVSKKEGKNQRKSAMQVQTSSSATANSNSNQQVLQMNQLIHHAEQHMTNFEMTPQKLERFMSEGSFNHGCRGSSPQNIFQNSNAARSTQLESTGQPNELNSRNLPNTMNSNQNYCPPTEEILQQAINNILTNPKNTIKDSSTNVTQHDSFHRITMTPEELMVHLTRLEPSLSNIPPQELYHHVQHVLKDKRQSNFQLSHPPHQTVTTLQNNIEHLVTQHAPVEQSQQMQSSTLQQSINPSLSTNEVQNQELANKQNAAMALVQNQNYHLQQAILQQQHSLQKKKELTDNKGYVLGDLSLEEFVRAMETFNVDVVTDSALNLELPSNDPNLLEEAALAAKFVSTMAFLSPSTISPEVFEDKSLDEEKARQYQAGYHTAILMAKKHWPDNYSVHPKIISEQTPSDTPNSVQVSSNEPDVKTNNKSGLCEPIENINVAEQILLTQQPTTVVTNLPPPDVSSSHSPLLSPPCTQHNNQVQVATQTQVQTSVAESKSSASKSKGSSENNTKSKKSRYVQPRVTQEQQYASDNGAQYGNQPYQQTPFSCMDVDSETDSNHDTALTLACAGGHDDLVELLLSRGADIEHRDKKGFTPLILAATAGHDKVVDILLTHNADIEAQSERTKDTPLSLACSGGRYEVVELLLNRGANKEHRNVSDYTPLSLAASGGYVNIIKLLLSHAAEINSRTGSKLGISPLMLAAMNGHTAAVKLLLDMGSDINAQIETNRNTALTLACFQGRHEVVSLLLDRKANVEHRAKTGLTPLMEAASGGYVDVGRVLLDKGADVNATPVPSSRDTALTIAADKGHCRFVELLLSRNAAVEVKNKKGNSPLWLAANGGHLYVVEILYSAGADIDSQDNRKVSCLMAAFRKGHTQVVKWMVNHVTQFPSDQEMTRYICTISDKELLEKCHECVKTIRAAKDTQAAKANKNATILLEELDMEKNREESKKAAAARRRERKKKKKLEKKEEKRKLHEENQRNEDKDDDDKDLSEKDEAVPECPVQNDNLDKEEGGDSGIDANSQGSCSSSDVKSADKNKNKKKKKTPVNISKPLNQQDPQDDESKSTNSLKKLDDSLPSLEQTLDGSVKNEKEPLETEKLVSPVEPKTPKVGTYKKDKKTDVSHSITSTTPTKVTSARKFLIFESSRHPAEREDFEATGNENYALTKGKKPHHESEVMCAVTKNTSPKQSMRREEGWKEVTRKSSVQVPSADTSSKKVIVPLHAIARVIGRGGSNINAIRGATGAFIEIEKQSKGQGDRSITIKGPADALKQAYSLIQTLIKDSDVDIMKLLPQVQQSKITPPTNAWEKPPSLQPNKLSIKVTKQTSPVVAKTMQSQMPACNRPNNTKIISFSPSATRPPSSRLLPSSDKKCNPTIISSSDSTVELKTSMSYTSAILTSNNKSGSKISGSSFAEKLSEITSSITSPSAVSSMKKTTSQAASVITTITPASISPKHHRLLHRQNVTSAHTAHCNYQNPPGKATILQQAPPSNQSNISVESTTVQNPAVPMSQIVQGQVPSGRDNRTPTPTSLGTPCVQKPLHRCSNSQSSGNQPSHSTTLSPMEYTLFKETPQQSMWNTETSNKVNFSVVNGSSSSQASGNKYESNTPQVDISKAPGYRGTAVSSPVGSKTSSNSTTPPCLPNLPQNAPQGFGQFSNDLQSQIKSQVIQPMTGLAVARPTSNNMSLSVTVGPNGSGNPGTTHSSAPPTPLGSMLGVQSIPIGQPIESSGIGHSSVRLDQLNMQTNRQSLFADQRPMSTSRTHQHHSSGGMASPAFDDASHLLSYHHTSGAQNQHCNTTVTMSRLNPRASAFSSTNSHTLKQLQSQPLPTAQSQASACQNQMMFNNTPLYHQNPNTLLPQHTSSSQIPYTQKSSMQLYNQVPRPNPTGMNGGFTPNRWPFMSVPYPGDLGTLGTNQSNASGFCHLSSLTNIGHSQDIVGLENGGLVTMNMPSMSPINQSALNGATMEDRKIPRPIGTERAWKFSNHSNAACNEATDPQSWIMSHHEQSKQSGWPTSQLVNTPSSFIRKQYEDMSSHDRYQPQQQPLLAHQMQSEPSQAQYINPLMHSLPPIVPSFLPGSSDATCSLDNACGDSWDPEKQSWGPKWNH
ncbi:ankyrin repeat domain-containing protein 17-like isoform X4 [Ctenocephalides felis]|uniref:ankyrin repeat domain-containing protein 17-like isoform X4 n=1 Tax=Ctenocephalides felis TaxID=7515 RepID=UPI000E6E2DF7|nr:ankyrin repeat domain-containing protein 17-like isoform X4 [Ctenocephalides felis]